MRTGYYTVSRETGTTTPLFDELSYTMCQDRLVCIWSFSESCVWIPPYPSYMSITSMYSLYIQYIRYLHAPLPKQIFLGCTISHSITSGSSNDGSKSSSFKAWAYLWHDLQWWTIFKMTQATSCNKSTISRNSSNIGIFFSVKALPIKGGRRHNINIACR